MEEVRYSRGTHEIKFDLYFETPKTIAIVELEIRRSDPVHNILKILHYVNYRRKTEKKIKIIHILEKTYYTGTRKKLTDMELMNFLCKRFHFMSEKLHKVIYRKIMIDVSNKMFRNAKERDIDIIARNLSKKILRAAM